LQPRRIPDNHWVLERGKALEESETLPDLKQLVLADLTQICTLIRANETTTSEIEAPDRERQQAEESAASAPGGVSGGTAAAPRFLRWLVVRTESPLRAV